MEGLRNILVFDCHAIKLGPLPAATDDSFAAANKDILRSTKEKIVCQNHKKKIRPMMVRVNKETMKGKGKGKSDLTAAVRARIVGSGENSCRYT